MMVGLYVSVLLVAFITILSNADAYSMKTSPHRQTNYRSNVQRRNFGQNLEEIQNDNVPDFVRRRRRIRQPSSPSQNILDVDGLILNAPVPFVRRQQTLQRNQPSNRFSDDSIINIPIRDLYEADQDSIPRRQRIAHQRSPVRNIPEVRQKARPQIQRLKEIPIFVDDTISPAEFRRNNRQSPGPIKKRQSGISYVQEVPPLRIPFSEPVEFLVPEPTEIDYSQPIFERDNANIQFEEDTLKRGNQRQTPSSLEFKTQTRTVENPLDDFNRRPFSEEFSNPGDKTQISESTLRDFHEKQQEALERTNYFNPKDDFTPAKRRTLYRSSVPKEPVTFQNEKPYSPPKVAHKFSYEAPLISEKPQYSNKQSYSPRISAPVKKQVHEDLLPFQHSFKDSEVDSLKEKRQAVHGGDGFLDHNGLQFAANAAAAEKAHGHGDDGRLTFQLHGQKGPHSYRFGFDTGKGPHRQFRYEERANDGTVKGRYGYYDSNGKLQTYNYSAHPKHGYSAAEAH